MSRLLQRCTQPLYLAFAAALLALSLAGCAATQTVPAQAAASPAPSQAIAGRWNVEDSTAVFTIRFVNGAVQVTGEDTADGEAFVVTNTHWDGTTLTGDFLMPSTNWRTHSQLLLVDGDTLSGSYQDGSPEIWRRTR